MNLIFFIFLLISPENKVADAQKSLDQVSANLKKVEKMYQDLFVKIPGFKEKHDKLKKEIEKNPKAFLNYMISQTTKDMLNSKTDEEKKANQEILNNMLKLKKMANFDNVKNVKDIKKEDKKVFPKKYKTREFKENPFTSTDIFDLVSDRYKHRYYAKLFNITKSKEISKKQTKKKSDEAQSKSRRSKK